MHAPPFKSAQSVAVEEFARHRVRAHAVGFHRQDDLRRLLRQRRRCHSSIHVSRVVGDGDRKRSRRTLQHMLQLPKRSTPTRYLQPRRGAWTVPMLATYGEFGGGLTCLPQRAGVSDERSIGADGRRINAGQSCEHRYCNAHSAGLLSPPCLPRQTSCLSSTVATCSGLRCDALASSALVRRRLRSMPAR